MVYQWKIPNLYPVTAQEAGQELENCKNTDGFITPAAVVQRARMTDSAIHGCFEWDDPAAAEQYRLRQAKDLIRNIVTVCVTKDDKAEVPVRAFVNIKTEEERGYKSIHAVVCVQSDYEYLLDCAKRELEAFEQKYATLGELKCVFDAIREVVKGESS